MSWQSSEDHAAKATGAGANATAATTSDVAPESAISPIILAGCLALAVGAGAFLSLSGTSGLGAALDWASIDNVLETVGLHRNDVAESQARKLARLDRGMEAVSSQVVDLMARMKAAGLTDEASAQRFARLDSDVDGLKTQLATIQTAQNEIYTIGGSQVDVALLRSTIDDSNSQIAAVNKRLDRIETIVAGRADVTASISTPPRKRSHRAKITDWSAKEIFGTGVVVVGSSGTYEAKPGTIIPGLGRIEAIRQEGGHAMVVTSRGSLTVE